MIRRWLRNWLGISTLETMMLLRADRVSREGRRIEPNRSFDVRPGTKTITITSAGSLEAPEIKKGYDAPVR